jgi:aminopeptidase
VIRDYSPSGAARSALEIASVEQLSTFHRAYYRGLAQTVDHRVAILSTHDPFELDGIEPAKLLAGRRASRPWRQWLARKEDEGRYTWTLALYGTPAMAKEARMPLAAYWDEIVKACFLEDPDPIERWREVFREIARVKRRLDALAIERIHVEGEGVDLSIAIGAKRRWLGGTGRNVPSFEIFTSPDWRGTEGTITFTEPVYRDGGIMKGVRLRFERGEIVEASASANEALLTAMIDSDRGASRVGEVSLTDGRVSPITRFMAETLYDENRGGPEGNFHLAIGNAYHEAFSGDAATLRSRDFARLGFNTSMVHTDIVTTARRMVTATLPSGRKKVIYTDGRFTV